MSSIRPGIAFVIFRMNCYRVMAPAIDAALARGWRVECWHDVGAHLPGRPDDVPALGRAPVFTHGTVTFHEYLGAPGFTKAMRERDVDAVVNLLPALGAGRPDYPAPEDRPLTVMLEPSPGDWLAHVRDPEELRQVDLYALTTEYWAEQSLSMMHEMLPFPLTPALERHVRERVVFVGWPQADQRSVIDPAEVRRRWGVPAAQPVLVYCNWAPLREYGLRPDLFGRTTTLGKVKALARQRGDWRQAARTLRRPSLRHVVDAVARFVRRNGLFVVVKHRHRDRPDPVELALAGHALGDESYYPHSIMEAMSIAALSVSYLSMSVRESIVSGVPHVAVDAGGLSELRSYGEPTTTYYQRHSAPGGPWNTPGVCTLLRDVDLDRTLAPVALSQFRMSEAAAEAYRGRYIGPAQPANAELFLDAVEAAVCARAAGR